MQRISTFLKGFLCLLNKKWFLEDLVNIDYDRELISNKQLRESSEQRKNENKIKLHEGTLERRKLFCRKLWFSFLWILAAAIIGMIIGGNVNGNIRKLIGILSIFCFSWATLGRLGWESWKGETVFEKLDIWIFWLLYFLGTLFGVVSIIAA